MSALRLVLLFSLCIVLRHLDAEPQRQSEARDSEHRRPDHAGPQGNKLDTPVMQAMPLKWQAPSIGSPDTLGSVCLSGPHRESLELFSLHASFNGLPLVLRSANWTSPESTLVLRFSSTKDTTTISVRVANEPGGLVADISADQPVVSSLFLTGPTNDLQSRSIHIPYYDGDVRYSQRLKSFLNVWWDWNSTGASRLDTKAAVYLPKTDGTRNLVHEMLHVRLSPDFDSVLPDIGNPPSPFMADVSGRPVLDIWNGSFAAVTTSLKQLHDYGLGNCVAIIHNWQHLGYDNALPEHLPANPQLGGDEELKSALDEGKSAGCFVALHENYVDYYPNYRGFNPLAVAVNRDGTPVKAWLHSAPAPKEIGDPGNASIFAEYHQGWAPLADKSGWIGIQSFTAKPSWMMLNAQSQSPAIHAAFGTNADYLDVHSAAPISSHQDMDASMPNAAKLQGWFDGNRALWRYERDVHHGPVFGEGLYHWYSSGLLDGVEAQLGVGVPQNQDVNTPLLVDFDLLKIHPLQVNHGMGYYGRWTADKSSKMTWTQMDAYRTQEVAFGHAPFLSTGTWDNLPLAFLETNLAHPVAQQYGTAKVRSIQYNVGNQWVTSSDAVVDGHTDSVMISYDNEITIVANSSDRLLRWEGLEIPQFGWAAKGPHLLAFTAKCGPSLCDYARTEDSLFVNARNASDFDAEDALAQPLLASASTTEVSSLLLKIRWKVAREFPAGVYAKVFVHIVKDSQIPSPSDPIILQADHALPVTQDQWNAGKSIEEKPLNIPLPKNLPPGQYSIRVGLYDPVTGKRLPLDGIDDGSHRYLIGILHYQAGEARLTLTPAISAPVNPRLNPAGTILSFPSVKTDGMFSLHKENQNWVLRPVPRTRNFTILLRSKDYPMPATILINGPNPQTLTPKQEGEYWSVPLVGAISYIWPTRPSRTQ